MPSSDSEDFESADEGHNNPEKKDRKKRLSSSNYSDNVSETNNEPKQINLCAGYVAKNFDNANNTVGWDDFEIDENEPVEQLTIEDNLVQAETKPPTLLSKPTEVDSSKPKDTGWNAFNDWGEDSGISNTQKEKSEASKSDPPVSDTSKPDPDIKSVADRLAAVTTEQEIKQTTGGWGWGWTVDSLLSSATAGISTLTTQVTQGLSTVLETGIGAPDPEELARVKAAKENEGKLAKPDVAADPVKINEDVQQPEAGVSDAPSSFGNLISGVTKFVENTGSKVLIGGLDTLETIGKKTMEVLQDGDPGLAKKRAMLGLDPGDKPVLSQVLREAKSKADEEDRLREEKREAKQVHYENLFDDYEGLVHLEALEMLSRQVSMRIDERLRTAELDKKQDIKETLQQVAELCEMPEEDEEEEEVSEDMSKSDAFHEKLQVATQDLGLKLQFQPIVKQYTDILDWISSSDSDFTEKTIYKRGVSGLAHSTALSVELYHKAAEMLLVKTRRSTADEADALTQMTVVLTKHVSELATVFTEKLNSIDTGNTDQVNNCITNIFLEAGNSSTYIQNAFQLALPILQIGAV